MFDLGAVDLNMHYHQNELLREAEHERLALAALGPGRSLRARLAEGLHALADRIDERPRQQIADELAAA